MQDNELLIIGAAEVEAALHNSELRVIEVVRDAYQAHARGETSLPHSSFLRFPDSDKDRIICLPAYLGGSFEMAGVKWIASMPGNLERGLERASAVTILNDRATGRPRCVLEGSIISKQRTAASAALAASVLAADEPETIGFIGCGPINLSVARFLHAVFPNTRQFITYDLDESRARFFGQGLGQAIDGAKVRQARNLDEVMSNSPMVSFGTTAIKPHIESLDTSPDNAIILHVSLRDLGASTILAHHNVVDDLDHVNRAATSIHLASEQEGNTRFVHASLGDLLLGRSPLPERDGRKVIFSPFGLGILDLAVADLVQSHVAATGGGTRVSSFLP